MKLSIDVQGLPELRTALRDLSERRLNAGIATGLTRTAVQVRDAQRQAMTQVFDRPTPYTLNSLWLQPASGNRAAAGTVQLPGPTAYSGRLARSKFLEAQVYLKDDSAGSGTPATQYLQPQIGGGTRAMKRLEETLRAGGHLPAGWFVVPGQFAMLDAYGNVKRGQIIQVLSQLRITLLSGFTRGMSRSTGRARSAQRKAGGRYFVMPPGGRTQPGVYLRSFVGNDIFPVFIFVRRVTYRPRFDFFGIAQRVAGAHLERNVTEAVAEQVQRLQAQAKAGAR
jgi:hypothetical protein